MLILTRKPGESIQIGDEIQIKILEVSRQFVKVGIEAPRSVKIHREEIYERIREENIRARDASVSGLSSAAKLMKKKKGGNVAPPSLLRKKKAEAPDSEGEES